MTHQTWSLVNTSNVAEIGCSLSDSPKSLDNDGQVQVNFIADVITESKVRNLVIISSPTFEYALRKYLPSTLMKYSIGIIQPDDVEELKATRIKDNIQPIYFLLAENPLSI